MAVLAAHITMAASTAGTLTVDLGRPYLKQIIVLPQADVQFRITNQGMSFFPTFAQGCDLDAIPVDRIDAEINLEMKGPPYELTIDALNNSAAGERTIRFLFIVHPTPYPKVKVFEQPGFSKDLPDDNSKKVKENENG